MPLRTLAIVLAAFVVLGFVPPGVAAETAGPHELFEARCGRCHGGHAGRFARAKLVRDGDVLLGRKTGRRVRAFLPTHFGRPTAAEVDSLHDMFRRQIAWGGLFQERCTFCHARARDLARRELVIEDGVLRGRYTGRDMREFLLRHGRSSSEEAATLRDMLRWQVETGAR